jgi:hypothetical protein
VILHVNEPAVDFVRIVRLLPKLVESLGHLAEWFLND